MTVISSIIFEAYRESNLVALAGTLNNNQVTEALRLLNAIFSGIYGDDAGENLQDFPLGNFGRSPTDLCQINVSDRYIHHPPINSRLIAVNDTVMTLYLTERPQDGSRYGIIDPFGRLAAFPITLDANGRTIEGSPTLILNTDGQANEWFYRADLGDWVKLTALAETDQMPFPADFDAMFITTLAVRLNPRYGRALDDLSLAVLRQGRRSFEARYMQSRPLWIDDSISWPFMSTQSYDIQRSFSSTRGFNRGAAWEN